MQKIACVFSFQESSWLSCQKIVFNLHKAYEVLPNVELRNFNLGIHSLTENIMEICTGIQDMDPDTIVFMDHRPHPLNLLRAVLPLCTKKKPRIIFHVFGDFTLYYKEWSRLAELLKGFPVTFIVASERQKLLIDRFLTPHHVSYVVPFPVRTEDFYFDSKERDRQRDAWGMDDRDLVLTFSGRISRQKRIHLLLPIFHEALQRETDKRLHLFIYGLPDHIGDTFLNIWDNENEYFRKVDRIYKEFPSLTRDRIHFMGGIPNRELNSVYAGSDYLINLSVHNDEDYGMSVAEAQMTGLPSILTDWGGLSSFYQPQLPEATKYIEVKIGKMAKIFSKAKVIETIDETVKASKAVDRELLMNCARERFSIAASAKKLGDILEMNQESFVSFSDFHSMITKRMILDKPVYLTKFQTIHPIYRKIYSAYVRNP